MTIEAQREDVPTIIRKLVENDIKVYAVASQRQTLEEYFLAVTQEEDNNG